MFISKHDMVAASPLPGWSGKFFHSEHMTFAHWTISDGADHLHEHQHEQEEVWNVVDGSIVLVVDGIEGTIEAGGAAVVPANTSHSARVIGAAEVLVADFPVRKHLPGTS
jgi:mannose-6-phosphate isomerase-like protein (cupin superfamily)